MNTLVFGFFVVAGFAGDKTTTMRWDFEDAAVGKLPSGWVAVRGGKGEGSVWKVVEDKTAPQGAKVLAQVFAKGPNSLFNLCIADKPSVADLDFTISFKAVAGKKDQGGGPVWRYQDSQNYYIVRMNPLEDNFRLYKVVAGKRIMLASADVTLPSGKWHTIRVVQRGNRIQCYLDGKLHFDVKDDTFKKAGKIGLWTKADAQTYFDNLVLRKPE
ncbi:MAG: DUF1080 domain-containing protein [Planctomycetes bacterium]|jgi:hypothetical protein|nr:DUF1080 domain-containing protein [Planctomycetota bacterium]